MPKSQWGTKQLKIAIEVRFVSAQRDVEIISKRNFQETYCQRLQNSVADFEM